MPPVGQLRVTFIKKCDEDAVVSEVLQVEEHCPGQGPGHLEFSTILIEVSSRQFVALAKSFVW